METLSLRNTTEGLAESMRTIFSDMVLILAAIGADDNRLELELEEARSAPEVRISEEATLSPVPLGY